MYTYFFGHWLDIGGAIKKGTTIKKKVGQILNWTNFK